MRRSRVAEISIVSPEFAEFTAKRAAVLALTLAFPNIDPIAIQIGPLAVRWYALAYIAGIVLGWRYAIHLAARPPVFLTREAVDDFIVWVTLGIILGGRLGYVLFYKPGHYLFHPHEALFLWQGGMSFHGGLIGVLVAVWLFARRRGVPVLAMGDLVATVAPIGLLFGRIANFINGELYGRVAPDVAWAMVFPGGGPWPRHPSQLYEAALEGLVLFAVMAWAAHRADWRTRPGRVGGVFLAGYALARITAELFREPDAHLGFIVSGITMGQILSLPMLAAGIYLIVSGGQREPLPDKRMT
jgi:phosphatidylglycerol:prolipoprotein diacylglycerol transferase